MKLILLLFILVNSSIVLSSECNDLMRSFFKEENNSRAKLKTAEVDITKYGLLENDLGREKFEHLYLQCTSSGKNRFKDLAQKRFSFASNTINIGTNVVGYSIQNWDKPKNSDWFKRLGFGVTFGAIAGKLQGKFVKNNGNRFQYLVQDYLYGRGVILLYLGSAPILLNNNQANLDKLETLKNSPHFKEDIEKLKAYANNDQLVERYKKELITRLSKLDSINLGIGIHEGVDFNNLLPSDLQDKDIQEVVLASMIAEEYAQQNGALNITGSNTSDFYLYDSLYSIAKIPKDIFVNKLVEQALCMNSYNIGRGLTQAIGITIINQIFFADFYSLSYRGLKKELINQ